MTRDEELAAIGRQMAEAIKSAGLAMYDTKTHSVVPIDADNAFLARIADKIAPELDVVEAVLADPLTIRRIRAMRLVRATLKAVAEAGNE